MKRFQLAAVGIVMILMSGCGADDKSAAKPSVSPSTTTSAPVPKVSEKTICDLLFDSDVESPMQDAVDLVSEVTENVDASGTDVAKAKEAERSLRSIAERAPGTLAPHLVAVADVMKDMQTYVEKGGTGEFAIDTFKSSGLEVSNVCLPLL